MFFLVFLVCLFLFVVVCLFVCFCLFALVPWPFNLMMLNSTERSEFFAFTGLGICNKIGT